MALATLMLAAALLAGQQPQAETQKGWVIEIRGYTFHAQPQAETQNGWVIEIRGYTYHGQPLPKEQIFEPVWPKEMQPGQPKAKIDVIEGIYADDLRSFFEKMKKEKR